MAYLMELDKLNIIRNYLYWVLGKWFIEWIRVIYFFKWETIKMKFLKRKYCRQIKKFNVIFKSFY